MWYDHDFCESGNEPQYRRNSLFLLYSFWVSPERLLDWVLNWSEGLFTATFVVGPLCQQGPLLGQAQDGYFILKHSTHKPSRNYMEENRKDKIPGLQNPAIYHMDTLEAIRRSNCCVPYCCEYNCGFIIKEHWIVCCVDSYLYLLLVYVCLKILLELWAFLFYTILSTAQLLI